jgi:hypothetical protein
VWLLVVLGTSSSEPVLPRGVVGLVLPTGPATPAADAEDRSA